MKGKVRGLQIWRPRKAATGEIPRRGARKSTDTIWKGTVGVMPIKTPMAIPQESFQGSSWRRRNLSQW
jgi:hypothetical protein